MDRYENNNESDMNDWSLGKHWLLRRLQASESSLPGIDVFAHWLLEWTWADYIISLSLISSLRKGEMRKKQCLPKLMRKLNVIVWHT